jgi:outer membrane protein assembly factor BamD (BamD/ComL family)
MKKTLFVFAVLISALAFAPELRAQKQLTPMQRDPVLEADAKHNLEVAQNYFRTRKAYRAVLLRFEETFAAYPEFSKMDEFLYIAAMSSYYLSDNKGKQKLNAGATEEEKKRYSPERLREDAVAYFALIVEKFPDSRYRGESEKMVRQLSPK